MMKRQKLQKGKLESGVAPLADDQVVAATIKVKEPDYVPEGVSVRSRIDEYFFTANTTANNFDKLSEDPLVESFSAARPLRMIK